MRPRDARVEHQDRPLELRLAEIVAGVAQEPEANAVQAHRARVPAVHLIRLIESAVVLRPSGVAVMHVFCCGWFAREEALAEHRATARLEDVHIERPLGNCRGTSQGSACAAT